MKLKAPFPWFGGKSRVAHLVWERFGATPNYVEPFAGSLAVLLGRPFEPRIETVNDKDCYLSNFWRAIAHAPADVAEFADWPVNEADLHARHRWLHAQDKFREKLIADPHFFDARIAGYWVWGLSCWIGDNWCRPKEKAKGPGVRGQGSGPKRRLPNVDGYGDKGVGALWKQKPVLTHFAGIQVHAKRPVVAGDNPGRGAHKVARRSNALEAYFDALAGRLRRVRVCCGDWSRVLAPAVTRTHGVTGVFLDPPYGVDDRDKVYNHDSKTLAADVRAWCEANGQEKSLRIALCGYDGEHNALEKLGWSKLAWKANGGYGVNEDNKNSERERIWFSPHCLRTELF